MRARPANIHDLPAMRRVMHLAIEALQSEFLSAEQVAASHAVMGLDTQLVIDGTYFIVEEDAVIAGCGGWSRRATLYGGDHSSDLRDPRLLDPDREAARIRAMYTHPAFTRRGVGRLILHASETAARAEGFGSAELMATLAEVARTDDLTIFGQARTSARAGTVTVPLIRMGKRLA